MCGDVTGSDVAPPELRRFRLVGRGLQICRSYGVQEATLLGLLGAQAGLCAAHFGTCVAHGFWGLPGTKNARLYKQKASRWRMRAGARIAGLRATTTCHLRQRLVMQAGTFREKTHNIRHLNPPECHDTPDVRPLDFFPASPFAKGGLRGISSGGRGKSPLSPPLLKGGTFFCGLGCGDSTGWVQLRRSDMCVA